MLIYGSGGPVIDLKSETLVWYADLRLLLATIQPIGQGNRQRPLRTLTSDRSGHFIVGVSTRSVEPVALSLSIRWAPSASVVWRDTNEKSEWVSSSR
jgi:hypothetical protein